VTSGGGAGGEVTASSSTSGGQGGSVDDCPRVRVAVAPGASLNVRPTPSTTSAAIGSLANNAVVDVVAQVAGEVIDGSDLWYEIQTDTLSGFIFSAYAACTTDIPPELMPPDGYWLPLACGVTKTVSQGNFGSFSHMGRTKYAFDFSLGVGTPMVAMADGIVHHIYADTMPGDPCYNGGDSSCFPYANLVVLLHGDGATSIYKHLSVVTVSLGEFVPRGTQIGLSGSTGYSTGPHAHVMLQEDCGDANCESLPLEFVDAGVPNTGDSVTSMNCP
jgi:murein DD-endopeptidase MepM/ murein hydrolase activator NlpD